MCASSGCLLPDETKHTKGFCAVSLLSVEVVVSVSVLRMRLSTKAFLLFVSWAS